MIRGLLRKEFTASFLTLSGILTGILWLGVSALFLWMLPGEYNLLTTGYAEFEGYFRLLYLLMIFWIPVWTMRSYAEEYRSGSWELLESRPITYRQIWWSKALALWMGVAIWLALTLIHLLLAGMLTTPSWNLDWGAIFSSYLCLWMVSGVFVLFGMAVSAVVKHTIGAIFVAVGVNALFAYGWDWLQMVPGWHTSGLFSTLSLTEQTKGLLTGLVDSRNLLYLILLMLITTELVLLWFERKRLGKSHFYPLLKGYFTRFNALYLLAILLLLSHFFFFRLDFTADKRYSLKEYSYQQLEKIEQPLSARLLLDGEMQSGFVRLRQSVIDLLDECNIRGEKIRYSVGNPFRYGINEKNEPLLLQMEKEGVGGINVNDRDSEGKISQKRIFPYLMLTAGNDTVWVELLRNDPTLSGAENLNRSISELEYRLMDGIRRLQHRDPMRIAMIEGHGEMDEPELTEALNLLGQTYEIDRGGVPMSVEPLQAYRLLVIAAPRQPFTEQEKYVLDRYVQQGGSLLLMIDGADLSRSRLYQSGSSEAVIANHGLSDLLFRYGVRVQPNLVQDVQCATIPVKNPSSNEFIPAPWYFAPVLFTQGAHPINRNLPPLKSEFCSPIEWIGTPEGQQRTVLYSTSSMSRSIALPSSVSLREVTINPSPELFNAGTLPIVVMMEGHFSSPYHRRPSPIDGTVADYSKSKSARILIAPSSLLRNEVEVNRTSQIETFPLGYDRFTQTTYGNAPFVENAVHYLAGQGELISLRNRQVTLRLIDKQKSLTYGGWVKTLSLVVPIALLSLIYLVLVLLRKRKYCYDRH